MQRRSTHVALARAALLFCQSFSTLKIRVIIFFSLAMVVAYGLKLQKNARSCTAGSIPERSIPGIISSLKPSSMFTINCRPPLGPYGFRDLDSWSQATFVPPGRTTESLIAYTSSVRIAGSASISSCTSNSTSSSVGGGGVLGFLGIVATVYTPAVCITTYPHPFTDTAASKTMRRVRLPAPDQLQCALRAAPPH